MSSLKQTVQGISIGCDFSTQKADYLLKRDAQSTKYWDETFEWA